MMLLKWQRLPSEMQTEEVRKYYDILKKKRLSLFFKRVFDIVISFLMIVILSPTFLVIAIAIKIDSKGPVFYRQTRITQYGKRFKIHKFRSMVVGADKKTRITVSDDDRITKVGRVIRKLRLDEICQLFDVLCGNMTFVGTRPEVPAFVEKYTPEMMATLLLPAGITSEASVYFKDEALLLDSAEDAEKAYIEKILPVKMRYNLRELENFSIGRDVGIMFKTVFAVLGKEYKDDNITLNFNG